MKTNKLGYLFMSTALIAASILPTVVAASDETNKQGKSTVEINGGEFTLKTSEVEGFGTHKIENKKKTVATDFAGDFGVIDARGTQEGYEVTVSATPFSIVEPVSGFATGTGAYSLPAGSLSLASLIGITGVNNEPTEVTPSINTVDVSIDMGQASKIATADVGKGMGEYALTFGADALSLVIDPLTAKIDTVNYPNAVTPYESTITWNLVSGPGADTGEDNFVEVPGAASVDDFEWDMTDEGAVITSYIGTDTDIIIPSRYNGKPVVAIGGYAFASLYPELTSVAIPNTVKEIRAGAFSGNALTSVTIGNSVETIGSYAFESNQLTSVVIPDSVKTIESNAFEYNKLTTVTIGKSVSLISQYVFDGNSNLKTVHNYSGLNVSPYFLSSATITNH